MSVRTSPVRNADRTATMRQRLIEATIASLVEQGFGATTTVEVVKRAKVSRGAMLHHFPTRADLLIATTEHILKAQETFRRRKLRDVPRGEERFLSITDAMWETMQLPESIALTELMLGARRDAELTERFSNLVRQSYRQLFEGPVEVADDVGYANARLVRAMGRLHVAAMRGLTIDREFWGEGSQATDDAFELLVWYKQAVMRRLADPEWGRGVEYGYPRPLRHGAITANTAESGDS